MKVLKMLIYKIKVDIRPYKPDEFIDSMRSIIGSIRNKKGCLGFSFYRDSEKDNTYCLIGEWDTRRDMEKHFQTHDFEVLIGAARVLGETFEMNLSKVTKTGGYELFREPITQHSVKHQNSG